MASFTPKVLRLLSVYVTDVYLKDIHILFGDNGIALGPELPDDGDPGERRGLARRYVSPLDLNSNPTDRARMLAVYTDVMRTKLDDSARTHWRQVLTDAGFEVDPWSYAITDPAGPTVGGLTAEALSALDDPSAIHDHLARLGDTVDTDPRLAVSTAKALIESTAKCVISMREKTYSKAAKVPALVTTAQESLGLAAKDVSNENAALRSVLQSLATLAQSVAEIRNEVGVDHGAESVPWVRPRRARLVVGAAQVWCQLMLETLGDPDAPWRETGN